MSNYTSPTVRSRICYQEQQWDIFGRRSQPALNQLNLKRRTQDVLKTTTNGLKPANPTMSGSLSLLRSGFISASALVSLSVTILAYKRAIEPLYASVPIQSYLSQSLFIAAALGSVPSLPLEKAAAIYGVLLALAPHTAYWAALYSARWGDAVLGPAFTHAVVLVPLIAAGVCTLQSSQVRSSRSQVSTSRSVSHASSVTSIVDFISANLTDDIDRDCMSRYPRASRGCHSIALFSHLWSPSGTWYSRCYSFRQQKS